MDKSFEPCPSPAPDSKLENGPRLRRPMLYPVELRPQRTDDLTGTENERKRVKLTLSAVVAMREARAAGTGMKALAETHAILLAKADGLSDRAIELSVWSTEPAL